MHVAQLQRNMKDAVKRISPEAVLRWREAAYFRKYGEFELRLVKVLCHRDYDSIDVGANLGAYVHFMRRSSRCVYAFEPVPWLAEQLADKFSSRVIVRNLALSDRNDLALLHVPLVEGKPETGLSSLVTPGPANAEPSLELRVPTCRLDDAYTGEVAFVKIDVEGHERAVLDGAVGTISRCHPNILVEIEQRFGDNAILETSQRLISLGYGGYFVDHGQLKDIAFFDPHSMQRPEDIADYGPGKERTRFAAYVNNFIFLHHSRQADVLPKLHAVLSK